jgi:hypothetical protein
MSTSVHHALRAALATIIGIALLVMLSTLTGTAAAETVCPNAALRTGPSANLPDCRAYELVTPVNKNGGEAEVEELSPSGESAQISSRATLQSETTGDIAGGFSFYTLTRTAEGWASTSIAPSASEYEGPYHGFSFFSKYLRGISLDGRSTLWVTRRRTDPEPEKRVDDLYLERTPGGPLSEVGPMAPPSWPSPDFPQVGIEQEELGTTQVVEYSQDLSHVLLAGRGEPEHGNKPGEGIWQNQWTPGSETAPGDPTLYEYVGTGNTAPLPVGVNNEGKVISDCGIVLGGRGADQAEAYGQLEIHITVNSDNPISANGSTVFFVARVRSEAPAQAPCSSGLVGNELYARIDNGEPGAHTVAISEPSEADCRACHTELSVREGSYRGGGAYFQGASEDGSKVFFTTYQPLLGNDDSKNIYEYDFDAPAGERVVRVSGGDSTVSEPEAAVKGVVGISSDGSHVYFVAEGVLTRNPNSQGQEATQGADNLYVFDTETQTTSFIADLCSGYGGEKEISGSVSDPSCRAEIKEGEQVDGNAVNVGTDSELWGGSKGEEGEESPTGVNVTPDGRFLVFTSYADLTPDDASTGAAQVFEYDAQTGSLVRVSIGQDDFNDNGNNANPAFAASIVSPSFGAGAGEGSIPRGMGTSVSADGSYVFFESVDGLTPQALNGAVVGQYERENLYAHNVYEYHDGSVYLISDGKDIGVNHGSAANLPVVRLLGADPSGQDVFFKTNDALVPQDTDGGPDVYDARIDGGFPEPEARPQCAGDECQGPLSGAPVLLSPGSEFQAGGNNFQPAVSTPVTSKAKTKPKPKAKKKPKRKKRSKRNGQLSVRRHEGRGK